MPSKITSAGDSKFRVINKPYNGGDCWINISKDLKPLFVYSTGDKFDIRIHKEDLVKAINTISILSFGELWECPSKELKRFHYSDEWFKKAFSQISEKFGDNDYAIYKAKYGAYSQGRSYIQNDDSILNIRDFLVEKHSRISVERLSDSLLDMRIDTSIHDLSLLYLDCIVDDRLYDVEELADILRVQYNNAPDKEKVLSIHMFGLKYGYHIVSGKDIKISQIIKLSGLPDSYTVEVNKGVNIYLAIRDGKYGVEFKKNTANSNDAPSYIQQIYYGAPGSGKSFEINRLTKDKEVIRTTFHPDSDYSTFVGSYKPVMEECDVKVTPIVTNNGLNLQPSGIYKERRIAYKFVKQAFLKAYLGAWKKYVNRKTRTSIPLNYTFKINDNKYTITGINGTEISCRRVFPINIRHISVTNAWKEIWATGNFVMPTGKQSGKSLQQAISKWIYDNVKGCTQDSLIDGLAALERSIEDGKVDISKGQDGNQVYTLSKNSNVCIAETVANCSRDKIEHYYNGEKPESGVRELQDFFANLLQEIDSSSFKNAWNRLADAIQGKKEEIDLQREESVLEPQFLIIEEINRGNCAQIFGDLFQLLDRKNGFSEYPIEADEDIRKALLEENPDDGLSFGKDGLNLTAEQITYINQQYDIVGQPSKQVAEKIRLGQVLVLPPNLYIWATMNTSDQSLFPMDSAFKRRWAWKYVPIEYDNKDSKEFTITIGEKKYSWPNFLRKINAEIKDKTDSEDKQMGNFFIKHSIGEDEFKNKVMFYIWSEVGKENYNTTQRVFKYNDDKEFSFNELYGADEDVHEILYGFMDLLDRNHYLDGKYPIKIEEVTKDEQTTAEPGKNIPELNLTNVQ